MSKYGKTSSAYYKCKRSNRGYYPRKASHKASDDQIFEMVLTKESSPPKKIGRKNFDRELEVVETDTSKIEIEVVDAPNKNNDHTHSNNSTRKNSYSSQQRKWSTDSYENMGWEDFISFPKDYSTSPKQLAPSNNTGNSLWTSVTRIENPYNEAKKASLFKSKANDFKVKYKTELCKYFEINGYCKFNENCAYAHGKENLRSKVTNSLSYRTKKCKQFFENGYCSYGNRCQFAHTLKQIIPSTIDDNVQSYSKWMKMFSKISIVDSMKTVDKKPRLEVFKEIIDDGDMNRHSLFEDVKEIAEDDWYLRLDESCWNEYYDYLII